MTAPTGEGETVKVPDRIWLQLSDETTWCQDQINDDDVEYVRATPPTGDALREALKRIYALAQPAQRNLSHAAITLGRIIGEVEAALASQPVEPHPVSWDLREAAQEVHDILVDATQKYGSIGGGALGTVVAKLSRALAQPVETTGPWKAKLWLPVPEDYAGDAEVWFVGRGERIGHGPFTEPQARGVANTLNRLEPT